MLEMRQTVAHHDFRRHRDALKILAFEFRNVERRHVGRRMKVEVDQRAGCILHGCETLIERARSQQSVEQRLRHRLIGHGVTCVLPQYFRHFEPVLIKLRRQFDEIAWHCGPRKQRISDVRQHAVQRVAKFMKQRARVIERQQRTASPAAGLEKLHTLSTIGRMLPVSFS